MFRVNVHHPHTYTSTRTRTNIYIYTCTYAHALTPTSTHPQIYTHMYTNFYLVIGNPTKFITLSPSQNDFLTCKDGRTTTGEFFFLFFPSLFFFHTLLQLSTSVILGVQVFSLLFYYCMNCLHHKYFV